MPKLIPRFMGLSLRWPLANITFSRSFAPLPQNAEATTREPKARTFSQYDSIGTLIAERGELDGFVIMDRALDARR